MYKHLKKYNISKVKGALRISANCDTRKGLSEEIIPTGTVGWILGHNINDGTYLILWNHPRTYNSDNQCSVHPIGHVTITGRGLD